MDRLITMVENWDPATQVTTVAIFCLTFLFALLLTYRFFIFLRFGRPAAQPEQHECNDDDNLTGVCLKKNGCRTRAECEKMLSTIHLPSAQTPDDD